MKKLLITTAVMLMTVFVSSQAKAELLMLTASNGTTFNYDPSGAMADSLNLGSATQDNGLNDFAIFLGYNGDNAASSITPFELTNGTNITAASSPSNRGTVQFVNPLSNGVTLTTTANFRLSEVSPNVDGLGSTLLYDLAITAEGVTGANGGAVQSLVGFDFGATPGVDRQQGPEVVSGFGGNPGNVAIGEINDGQPDRILTGDFNFQNLPDDGRLISSANLNGGDLFNGAIGDNLDRFDSFGTPTFTPGAPGDVGFSAFSNFQDSSSGQFATAGVVQFRSELATNVTSTIPEPSALMMASMGLGMVAFRRRRKQRA